ncbi:K+-sensing histidine kinase KdpD [Variovorax sp. TBS-050B]|uniref:histidine kinase dimerization/phospho-acceptor domain-containing protein n=1 Tax=Variovorax sp. TBS-050B TaxID=2940551 RepID=UPI0024742B48|nr:histidine kinase dimerization/phospho-acceptor domain-containing protein [Variovorax sp. TBS-050B]MDH6594997.1 K+-sensing histidine kinase KdpD [Variovorax sp. TBS-050B]
MSTGSAALAGACAALLGAAFACAQQARSARMARQALAAQQVRQARRAALARRLEHDLRSPVGAMAVALELLRSCDDDATRNEAIAVLERQVARMTSLTERVHEFAQGMND